MDLFTVLMATRLISAAKRRTDMERLPTLPQLEKASRIVAQAAQVLIEELERVEETGTDMNVAVLWRATPAIYAWAPTR